MNSISPILPTITIGVVSVSDRASTGVYQDQGLPALKEWLSQALRNPLVFKEKLIPDEAPQITQALLELVHESCDLVLTTGGTGPAPRDVTKLALGLYPLLFCLGKLPLLKIKL
jgi:molybdopterin adenylyltransferase